jgi:hypothetical protein
MPHNTPLYIVASQHPGAGKTLLARLLIEFFRIGGRPIVGYDLDPREQTLAGYFPDIVATVDIAETPGQIALFDRLIADPVKTSIIDLGYGLFEQFFAVMVEIGFEREARRRSIDPIVLFIVDSAPTTARHYAELRRLLPQTTFVPVHNEATSLMFEAPDFPPTRPEYGVLRIPRLSPIVRGVVDRPGFSFANYVARPPGGPTEVHSWVGNIFTEFRELELRLLMATLSASLGGGAARSG